MAMARLHAACFPRAPWNAESCRETLQIPGTLLFLEKRAFLVLRMEGEDAEILSMGVDPEARGRCLGFRMVETACAHAARKGIRRLFLDVSEHNAAARKIYEKAGFCETFRRKRYYTKQGSGEDAILMKKELTI